MSQNQPLAVVDATDVQVVLAERVITDAEFNKEIRGIEAELPVLNAHIRHHVGGLAYAIVDCGLRLLKARELYRVATRCNTGGDGQFVSGDAGFLRWLRQACPTISQRTAYNYIYSAENAGLTADSKPGEVQMLRDQNALADTTAEKLRRRKPIQGPSAAQIAPPSPSEDEIREQVRMDWMARAEELNRFYEGWTAATWKHFLEEETWMEKDRKAREELRDLLYGAYCKLTDFQKQEDAARKVPAGEKTADLKPKLDKAKSPPPLPNFHFNFDQARGSRKLKGGRFWFGYQKPGEKIRLHPFRGKESEIEEIKKTLPADVPVVGPFYTKSLRYAKAKVKAALSGEPENGPRSEGIDAHIIEVP